MANRVRNERLEIKLTEEEKEIIRLRKQLKQLEMENDILKQAALLLGKR